MTAWSVRHDAYFADLARRFRGMAPGLPKHRGCCVEFSTLAMEVAAEHGLECALDVIQMPLRERDGRVVVGLHNRAVVGGFTFEALHDRGQFEIKIRRAPDVRTVASGAAGAVIGNP